jgi:uracil permease
LFALLVNLFGKDWINKLLPPIIVGPMIIIIGLSLAPSAISQIGLNGGTIAWKGLMVAIVSFLTTALIAIYGKGFIKVIPFLFGIISGYILAIILGMVSFNALDTASFFSLPKILIPFKDYSFSLVGMLTIAPIAFAGIAEHVGDHMALSTIIDKDLINDPGLDRTLLGDGLATTFAGLIGGPANTTYGENTSVVGMSKVASVWVIGLAAIISICLAFLGKITALFQTIPDEVLGGVSLLLYGFISVNGLKVLIENKVDFNNIRNVIIASSMLIFGLGGAIVTIYTGNLSFSLSGISLAALVGIILNLILKEPKTE